MGSIFVASVFLINNDGIDDYFVGVSFGGDSMSEAKLLIDRVKSFTNLFVVQSGPASKNETLLNEICDYAVNAELSIIVYFGKFDLDWQPLWLNNVNDRWGSKFLGVYFFDEPAGSLLDSINEMWNESLGPTPKKYNEMAEYFVDSWQSMPGLKTVRDRLSAPMTFTSDYALYWFDYLAGYDIVLAQFGWNHSRVQDIALIRGAARSQNKQWGIIVTWTFDEPPYLEDGEKIYDDLMIAYNNGAKYFVVFNYPQSNEYGILTDEHFLAIERFWNQIQNNSEYSPINADSVLVLPKNYGWGMRRPNDTIWGLWEADEKSAQIWNISRKLLNSYGTKLDIVYDDSNYSIEDKYSRIFYWNSTFN
ncbi:MAG: hypothetical protein P8X91_00240 [Candidatus Bathyarchaeota archaeon]